MLGNKFFIFLLFFLVSFIFFSPTFNNLNYFWDDERFVFLNPDIVQAPHWYSFWNSDSTHFRSWPLGYCFFWIFINKFNLYSLVFYKALNIFIHALNSFLLWRLLEKFKIRFSLLLSFLFLFHPLHVESVSWVFQFLTLISFSFFILSCLCLVKYVQRGGAFILGAYLFFLFSLWSKSIAILAPFLFVYFFYFSKTKIKHYLYLIPFFLFSLYSASTHERGILTANSGGRGHSELNFKKSSELDLEASDIQSKDEYKNLKLHHDYLFTPPVNNKRTFNVDFKDVLFQSSWHYYLKMFFPVSQQFIYPQKKHRVFLTILIVALVFIYPFLLFIKRKKVEFLIVPVLTISFVFPYLGFVEIPFFYWSYVSDRYTYFMLFIFIYVMAIILRGIKSDQKRNFFIISYTAFLAFNTVTYGLKFNNPQKLYEEIIIYKKNPLIYSLLFERYLISLDIKNCWRIWNLEYKHFPNDVIVENDRLRLQGLESNLGIKH